MRTLLERTKYISFIGIIALLLASVAAFGWGAMKTFDTLVIVGKSAGQDPYIAVAFIEVVDSFLIATALYVFAVSMYALFIGELHLPSWMLAHNLYELKDKLGDVIVLVMVVKFLEHLVEWKSSQDSLFFAIAVVMVSMALGLVGYFRKKG